MPPPKVSCNQLLPQDVESLCTDSALTYLHSIAGPSYYSTWFCCQTARWMLRSNLLLASCSPGSGPINPLGLFSAFVSGIEHLCRGYDQCLEPHHSEVSEALYFLASWESQFTEFSNVSHWITVESSQVKLYLYGTFHAYGCSMCFIFLLPIKTKHTYMSVWVYLHPSMYTHKHQSNALEYRKVDGR